MEATTGWTVSRLGNIATLQRGFDLPGRLRVAGQVPIISSSGTTDWHNVAMVAGPGVVTGRYGTIGKVFYSEVDFWPLNTTLYVSNFHGNDPRFIYYMLQRVDFASHSGKSGVPGVNRNDLHELSVAIPHRLEEQQAIAAALADVDRLITVLRRSINKKQAVKQGMMQQLLTGKTRLPGFGAPWRTATLGEAASILDNLRVPLSAEQRISRSGPYPYCGANGVLDYIDDYMIDDDVVLLAEDGGNFEQFNSKPIAYRMQGKIWVNNHAHVLKAAPGGDTAYLFYALERKDITPFISSGTRSKLTRGELVRIEIDLPSELAEQEAISNVLVTCDREIDALHQRLSKARDLKHGMMQELLTGHTRLQSAESAA
ncbi:restriction endonuclease subunit S [Arthrobacter sp. GCM10027362]|uniref:restriction endonuclease subunit S n=1 Tax=Arthrobacter sp. GCM10027362 TaxID=3273379 RepID=UPI003642FBF7